MNKLSIDNSHKINELRSTSQEDVRSKRAAANETTDSKPATGRDKLDFSDRASEVPQLSARVASLPDVRSELVAHFKQLFSAGEYKPSSFDISAALIGEEA